MSQTSQSYSNTRERAEREIALAKATGSKAEASPDYSKVFITRRDGTRETVRIAPSTH